MFILLTAACQIGAVIFGVLASFQKDEIDDIDKYADSDFKKEILKSTKETEFNTSSERFFRENNYDKEKYRRFFKYGYTVYHHSKNYKKPFKKSYGSELLIDYSNVRIIEQNTKSDIHILEMKNIFRNTPSEGNWSGNLFEYSIIINFNYVNKVQILRGINNYGLPRYSLVDCFILLNKGKPYTYAIGPQDSSFFDRRKTAPR